MHLEKLHLRHFRCHRELTLDLSPHANLFLGPNARGKTSILEAVFFLATGHSFRTTRWKDLIAHGSDFALAAARAEGHTFQVRLDAEGKKRMLDKKPVAGGASLRQWLQAVVFTTQDNQVAKAEAAVRRRFLDMLLAQYHPTYGAEWLRFKKILRSRNFLLKKDGGGREREALTEQFITQAQRLRDIRTQELQKLSPLARLAYRKLSEGREDLKISYLDSSGGDLPRTLERLAGEERRLRQSLAGPHRDDLLLTLDDRPATQFASEGQQRTVALALRLAQADLLTGLGGRPPVILLDDVMGELDAFRREALIRILRGNPQVLLTATEENWEPALLPEARRVVL